MIFERVPRVISTGLAGALATSTLIFGGLAMGESLIDSGESSTLSTLNGVCNVNNRNCSVTTDAILANMNTSIADADRSVKRDALIAGLSASLLVVELVGGLVELGRDDMEVDAEESGE